MRSEKWDEYEVGMNVRCTNPDEYYNDVARKLRDRVGTIKAKQQFSGQPIIDFPAIGRRKPFTWVCSHIRDIEKVTE